MFATMIPDFLVRFFARPYVAGDSLEDAIEVAALLGKKAGMLTTLDLLAEEVRSEERIRENVETYRKMIQASAQDARFEQLRERPTVSLKLSSFTLAPFERGGDGAGCREAVEPLAEEAHRLGVPLTIDMEDRHWTDFTLDLSIDLFQRGWNVGTALQSRLHRTTDDVQRIPEGMRVRMIIGIYPEPGKVALTSKPAMKQAMVEQSATLLERGVYVEYATHDEQYLRRFFREAVLPRKVPGDRYEIQMLFGVPRADVLRDILAGKMGTPGGSPPTVRLYVPFATAWDQATAYCRRRMFNNPALGLYVMRNLGYIVRGMRPGIGQYLVGSNGH